jgi:hypothetical protein
METVTGQELAVTVLAQLLSLMPVLPSDPLPGIVAGGGKKGPPGPMGGPPPTGGMPPPGGKMMKGAQPQQRPQARPPV